MFLVFFVFVHYYDSDYYSYEIEVLPARFESEKLAEVMVKFHQSRQ